MTERKNAGRPATRSDVARMAETSVAVVSYVLNNGPRNVSPARRERVLKAVADLNYQPSAIARSMTSTRTNTLGMIVPNISNGFFAELALAVENAAMAAGQLVFLGNANEDQEREAAYVDSFIRQRVDAVVLVGVAEDSSVARLSHAGVRTVVLDRAIRVDQAAAVVGIDNRAAAQEATEHLIGHGHRRVACLAGPVGLPSADDRMFGWRVAMRAAGLPCGDNLLLRSDFSIEGGRAALSRLRAQAPDATALFVASDEQARGVISAANGPVDGAPLIGIPVDLAIASVDGTREGSFCTPSLTSMQQPFDRLACAAVAAAVDPDMPASTVMSAALRVGHSCGCVGSDI